jgi:SAM-dependent methyltransferase
MRTKEVFERIAPGWYNFRHRSIFMEELEALAERWQRGKLLNLGCAHGPDFVPFRQGFELYGIDFSREMLKAAREYARKFEVGVGLVEADVGCLPFVDQAFDWAISVATYHHLQGRQAQEAALGELRRVLKPGGEALITVWNRWQRRFWLKPKELSVPWRTKGETLERYYYLFSYREIERLVRKAGFTLLRSFPERSYRYPLKFFSRNICLLVRK